MSLFDQLQEEQTRVERRLVLGMRPRKFRLDDGTEFDYTEVILTVSVGDGEKTGWGMTSEVLRMDGHEHAMRFRQSEPFFAEVSIREVSTGKDKTSRTVTAIKPIQVLSAAISPKPAARPTAPQSA